MTPVPTLLTDRLRLRAPRLADFEAWAAFYASERSRPEGGPLGRQAAWERWAPGVATWLLKGHGAFGIEDRASGAYLGEVGIYDEPRFAEPELGWFVVPEAEGRGIAAEAARALLDWARGALGFSRLISVIDPGNARSIALALRVGGVVDASIRGSDPGDVVIRHDLRAAA